MKQHFIVTGTVTYAMKGKNVLQDNGFKAEVKRARNLGKNYGCGYGISVIGDIETALRLLKQNGVKFIEVADNSFI